MTRVRKRQTQRAFTLIEVVVALAIIGVALAAVLARGTETVDSVSGVKSRTLARWVAQNRLAEMRLEPGWPDTDITEGDTEMVGRRWHWRADVNETDDDDLRRIEISVSLETQPEHVLSRIVGFEGRPFRIDSAPGQGRQDDRGRGPGGGR